MGLHSCNRLSFDFEPRWDVSLPRALNIVSGSITKTSSQLHATLVRVN